MAQPPTHSHYVKKKTLYAVERNRPDVVESRRRYEEDMVAWDTKRLVFVDESGVNLAMTRANARAPSGERVIDHVPGGRWSNYSVIAGLRSDGIIAPMLLPGAMNATSLRTWVVEVLCPSLRRDDIVIWDNLSIHTDPIAACAIAERGAWLHFLPAYSPDLNPIEKAWAKMKSILRSLRPRKWRRLVTAVQRALLAIDDNDAQGWFSHCGYTTE